MPFKTPTHTLRQPEEYADTAKAQADRRRGNSAARGYDAAWRKLRLSVLKGEPLCRHCKAEGKITPAQEVDHIDGDAWNRDRSNLRPLCKPCHSRRTAKEQAFRRQPKPNG